MSPQDSVTLIPSSSEASGGDSVNMTCSAKGGPHNVFTWVDGSGNTLGNGGRFKIENQASNRSVLTITDIVGDDHGIYTCQVTNNAGNDTAITTVIGTMILYIIAHVMLNL